MARREREHLKVVAMVIARMGSTRVPGKSLIEIEGRPLVGHMIDIARLLRGCDEVIVTTSELPADDPIAALGEAAGVPVVRGHPEYVLDRVHKAVGERNADIMVYVGGDCPLLDPVMLDEAIAMFFERGCDYLNNYDPPTFPEGLDVNVITRAAITLCYEQALAPSQRVHAFSYLTRHPGLCQTSNYEYACDLSHHHWSIDFPEDVEFVRAIYRRLHRPGAAIRMQDVLDLIARDPEIAALDCKLHRDPVEHAFWNAPGIMRDMNADIAALCELARGAATTGDKGRAHRCYQEIALIADELARFSL